MPAKKLQWANREERSTSVAVLARLLKEDDTRRKHSIEKASRTVKTAFQLNPVNINVKQADQVAVLSGYQSVRDPMDFGLKR